MDYIQFLRKVKVFEPGVSVMIQSWGWKEHDGESPVQLRNPTVGGQAGLA